MKRWCDNRECKTCSYGSGWMVKLNDKTKQYERQQCRDISHIQERK